MDNDADMILTLIWRIIQTYHLDKVPHLPLICSSSDHSSPVKSCPSSARPFYAG